MKDKKPPHTQEEVKSDALQLKNVKQQQAVLDTEAKSLRDAIVEALKFFPFRSCAISNTEQVILETRTSVNLDSGAILKLLRDPKELKKLGMKLTPAQINGLIVTSESLNEAKLNLLIKQGVFPTSVLQTYTSTKSYESLNFRAVKPDTADLD